MLSIQNPTAKAVRHLVAQNFSLSKALPPMITKLSKERHSIIHQMTVLFVTIDDFLTQHHEWRQWRRSPNCRPAFADSEVLTIALLQGCFKVATCEIAEQFARLKHAYQIIATDFAGAFPRLPSYGQFMARLHTLQPLVGRLIQHVLPRLDGEVYLMDSKPIPLCKPIRHVGFSRRKSLAQGTPFAGRRSLFWQE